MLFYLQEERRKNALNSSQARKEMTMDGFIGSLELTKDRQAKVRVFRKVFKTGAGIKVIANCHTSPGLEMTVGPT